MQISGSRILVTGASRGLGDVMARELSRRGASLVLSARSRPQLESLAAEVGGEVVVADLADRAQAESLHEIAVGCDAIVCNAGIGDDGGLDDVDPDAIDRIIDVNLRAPIQLATHYASERIAEGRPGAIVLIGSLAGIVATPGTRMYNATKFGLRGFALSFAEELHGTGVTCSLVAPGFIRDAGMFHDGGIQLPPGVRTKSPADVAAAVVRALTDAPPEVVAAPIELLAAARFGGLAPAISARVQRLVDAQGRQRRGDAQRERRR